MFALISTHCTCGLCSLTASQLAHQMDRPLVHKEHLPSTHLEVVPSSVEAHVVCMSNRLALSTVLHEAGRAGPGGQQEGLGSPPNVHDRRAWPHRPGGRGGHRLRLGGGRRQGLLVLRPLAPRRCFGVVLIVEYFWGDWIWVWFDGFCFVFALVRLLYRWWSLLFI